MKSIILVSCILFLLLLESCVAFIRHAPRVISRSNREETLPPLPVPSSPITTTSLIRTTGDKLYGEVLLNSRKKVLRDILGLGPAEIAITLVVSLVLFGPDTLKSLTKDVGKAAAELKELPQTFKEGMEEGQESSQVVKMKAIAAEKRKKRDEALNAAGSSDDDEEDNDDVPDAEIVN